MYLPKIHHETNITVLHDLMTRYSFATVVTSDADGIPFATHMPVALDPKRGPHGTLISHIARANPQWRQFQADREVLVIFQGPHTYISPSWYAGDFNVPTWNYATVHAYGMPRVVEDETTLQTMLTNLVATYESSQPEPWAVDWRDERNRNLLKAIVGFELEITRLEGKVKMNQNKSVEDRKSVIRVLSHSTDPEQVAVATMIRQYLEHERQWRR